MRRRGWLVVSVGLLILVAAVATATVPGLRWRAAIIHLKATGTLSELSWVEIARMTRPHGAYYIPDVARLKSAYAGIRNPYTSEDDTAAGLETFAARCTSCHGTGGSGSSGPALRDMQFTRSNSDWAMYKVIQGGIPGTAMPAHDMQDRELWQVVGAIAELRSRHRTEIARAARTWSVESVTADQLVGAASDSGNWLMYHGTYDGQRHSRLRHLDTNTVAGLRLLWVYQNRNRIDRVETTPLVIGQMMYLTEPGPTVVALEASTGMERWRFTPDVGEVRLCCERVNRGVAISGRTLYLATPDAHLIALEAETGRVRWNVTVADSRAGYSFTSAPLVAGGLVIAGVAGGEYGIRGFVDAYDGETGRRVWRFHTIPGPGEPGSETWHDPSAIPTGGGPAWLTGTFDPALGLLYLGVGNPGPNYDGSVRSGDNLYTNSVIALKVATGELAWHFQLIPHDTHDYDAVQVPVLVDAIVAGRPRRLLLFASKNAFYYVLDRETGRFLVGKPFATQTWAEGLDSTGRPIPRPEAAPTRGGTLTFPGETGATNWWSPSYSPRTGLFYLPVLEQGGVFYIRPESYETGERYGRGSGETKTASRNLLRALDAVTGELRWEHAWSEAPATLLGGVLTTAGGLVFTGVSSRFAAFHDRTGKMLWSYNVGGRLSSAPITWLETGRQRVTVAAGRAVFTFGRD